MAMLSLPLSTLPPRRLRRGKPSQQLRLTPTLGIPTPALVTMVTGLTLLDTTVLILDILDTLDTTVPMLDMVMHGASKWGTAKRVYFKNEFSKNLLYQKNIIHLPMCSFATNMVLNLKLFETKIKVLYIK